MDKIEEILTRIVANIIPGRKKLEELLRSGKKLNVYFGIDPTFTRIHLGNAVPLRKLQTFVENGHNVTFLIGDFTALIGDTSDKDSERPVLTYEQIENNFQTYKKQASKLVDFSKVKVRHNREWLKKLNFQEVIKLARHFSLNDFISRELIRKRLDTGKSVSLPEVLYPVMQGYDSYFMDTDIQIGGTDQVFNMQAGRTLQKHLRNKESFIIETSFPLEGTDGRKMSKSWGNAIWLDDSPAEIFGKIMSLKDSLIYQYFDLATKISLEELAEIKNQLRDRSNPMELKKKLAGQIISELHSIKDAQNARTEFEKTFQKGEPDFDLKIPLKEDLASTISPFTSLASISEAKRQIVQGSVDVDGKTVTDPKFQPIAGQKIQIGKRIFATVVEK